MRVRTETAIAKGRTPEAFLASAPTANYEEDWVEGVLKPEQFLTIVSQNLAE